jgi:YD repeat-containing protein
MLRVIRCCAAAATLMFAVTSYAQYPTTSDIATGLSPMAVYNVGDVDNVNPVNGNLFLNIPLLSYPQRGKQLRLNFRIYYNDKAWFIIPTSVSGYSPSGPQEYGIWSWWAELGPDPLGPQVDDIGVYVGRDQKLNWGDDQYVSNTPGGSDETAWTVTTTLNGFYVRSADGSKHYYGDGQLQTCSGNTTCPTYYNGYGNSYPSSDDTGYLPVGSNQYEGTATVIGPDGITYTNLSANSGKLTDPSGNSITTSSTGWQDTIGRIIPGSYALPGYSGGSNLESADPVPGVPASPASTSCPSGTYQARQWTVPSMGSGATETYYLCYQQFSYQTAFDYGGSGFWIAATDVSSNTPGGNNRPAVLLSNIMLPNGTSYAFSYDQYLSLASITLPTGASISYTWQSVYFGISATSPISRALLTRTINPGNGEAAQVWHYQFLPNVLTSAVNLSIVTDPNGNDVEYHLGLGGTISSESYYAGCGPDDTTSGRTCSGTSTLLKSVSNTVSTYGNGGADEGTPSFNEEGYYEPTTTTTTWPASGNQNLVTQTVTTMTPLYGTCYVWASLGDVPGGQPVQPTQQEVNPCYTTNQPYSVASYDYGSGAPGSLLKTVTTSYEWQSSSAYLNANLLDLPSSVVTTDGSGNRAAETDYYYDQSPSPTGAYGNLTEISQWLSSGSPVTNETEYNTQGMPIETIDPKNYTTTIAYDSTGAFPKTVTHPATTNNVPHVDQYVFDSNTGLTTSHTDWNGNTTTYSYINSTTGAPDPLNRLGQITYPSTTDGTTGNAGSGYKKYTYTDTPGSLAVTEQDYQSTNGTTVTHVNDFDGLGRVLHTVTSDPEGPDTVDTTYDLLGRVASVSNPYRYTSDPTYGITSYAYDPLGRKTLQTQPDGTVLQWCYDGLASNGQTNCQSNQSSKTGTWVDAADETYVAGKTDRDWQQVIDGLARMSAVVEPNGYETDYQYNSLSDLISVTQCGSKCPSTSGVNRGFSYDSLSRLISANNPESGSITYDYDSNSNLITRTAPAPNSATGSTTTITTTYTYDALNRLLSKSANDSAATPTACYQYDTSSQAGTNPNLNGRLANQWTQSSNTACPTALPSSGALTSKSILAYDALGRVLNEQTCVYPSCTTTPSQYPLTFSYDLVGNLITYSNGSTSNPITLTNGYDEAEHLLSITSGSPPSPLFSSPTYTAPGGLTGATYGTGLTLSRTYDHRVRITGETDTGSTVQTAAPGSATVTITGSEQTQ